MFNRLISVVLAAMASAQTEEDMLSYPDYAAPFDKYNLTWEPLKIKTDDGYTLTLFHITGDKTTGPFEITKPPLLMQHGMGSNGTEFTDAIRGKVPMAF